MSFLHILLCLFQLYISFLHTRVWASSYPLSPDNLFAFNIRVSKMMRFFKKQELHAKRVSDTEDLLKDIKTSFLCHLINVVLNSDLFSIAIYFSSYQHLNLLHVASIIKERVLVKIPNAFGSSLLSYLCKAKRMES